MSIETVCTVIGAVTAVLAAYFWLRATLVKVPAPKDTGGVGALIGGYLISVDEAGNRYDLHKTLENQAKWNIYAASAAALSALAVGASLIAKAFCI